MRVQNALLLRILLRQLSKFVCPHSYYSGRNEMAYYLGNEEQMIARWNTWHVPVQASTYSTWPGATQKGCQHSEWC